jgi:YbbR domain-containing protein
VTGPVRRRPRSQWFDTLAVGHALLGRARVQLWRSPGLAALSLVLGVALWLAVTEAENPTRLDRFPGAIPLEAANVGERFAVASQLPAVEVRIAAADDRWERLTVANFRAFVDLNNREAREQLVPVQIEVSGVRGVRVIEAVPATVLVNLEELATRQTPVSLRQLGTLPRGHELVSATPDRRTAEVVGPASLVALVEEVVAAVNLTGLTTGIEETVTLVPVARGGGEVRGVTVRPATARLVLSVALTALTRTVPLLPELTGQPAPGYRVAGVRVTPPTVALDGTFDVLQALDGLRLPPVDLTGQQADVRSSLRVTLPPGVSAAGLGAVVVEVEIEPIAGSVALTVAPEVTNVRSGLLVRVSPGSVTVTLDGPLPRLNALAAGAVRATVDAVNLGPGTSELRVNVHLPDGLSLREVQPAAVSVTLTRP